MQRDSRGFDLVRRTLVLAGCLISATSAMAQGYAPHRLLVGFTAGTSPAKAQQALDAVGARIDRELPQIGVKIVSLPANANEEVTARALARRPGVNFAELDRVMPPSTLNDPSLGSEWYVTKIAATSAWPSSSGAGVIIAILDSGCDPTHPDLAGHYVPGWNFYDNNSNTSDVQGHGTAVAGCAAAIGNNGIGMAGVAYNAQIMPLRISDTTGYAYWSTAATALTWAADHGARVANLSYRASASSTVQSAGMYLMQHGGVTTVSSGNDTQFEPAPDSPYLLTVGATASNDVLCSWSNTGNNLDLVGPGSGIFTTNRGGGYGSWSGTSFSAPITAGAAALVIAANPTLSGSQVQQIIKNSVDDLGLAGWDTTYGWGRLNAGRAVSMAMNGGTADTTPPTAEFSQPTTNGITLQGTFTLAAQGTDNIGVASMTISIDGVQVASSASGNCSYAWNTATAGNSTHQLLTVARDAAGNSSSTTLTVSVENPADVTPPSVTITSPAGGRVAMNLTVAASASDNVGVSKVEFYLDGRLVGTDTAAAWSFAINTRKWVAGNHTLQARAYDAAGNSSLSQQVIVTK